MSAATPEQAAAHAFVTGCVARGLTASQASVPPEGQLSTVRGLWADVAQAVVDAATEGSLRACGYTLADIGRFLETEAVVTEQPQPAPDGQAPGATFRVTVAGCQVTATADLPFPLDLGEREAAVLEATVRNAMAWALRPYLAASEAAGPDRAPAPAGQRHAAPAPALVAVARVCHEANRALQAAAGDPRPSLPWEQEPEEVRRFATAAVEFAARGGTPEEQFLSWRQAKEAAGWSYGPVKDPRLRTHPSMVGSYAELPERERVKDAVFAAVVRAMTAGGAAPDG